MTASNSNEVLIFVEQKGEGDQASDASKAQVLTALGAMYGVKDSSKPDFNAATPSSLAEVLDFKRPIGAIHERGRPIRPDGPTTPRVSRHNEKWRADKF